MKIVVCVKYVPDAQGDRRFSDADRTVDRAGTDGILSELDEYAVEEALKLAEADADSTVTALTVGPDGATDALRKALQMGATDAVHVVDDALHGSDAARHQPRARQGPREARVRPRPHRHGQHRRRHERRPGDGRRAARPARR